jgi:threonine synthase
MKLYSTNNKENIVDLKTAVLNGLAEDEGLFMPIKIPKMKKEFFENIEKLSFQEIAFEVAKQLFSEDISVKKLKHIIDETINFDAPLVKIEENIYCLELFHGPTLAFKDFGARFMSRLISYFNKKETLILVATSGDTGSAVAHGFYNIPGIKVVLLYPSAKVSKIQEQQLTTMGGNIQALEIKGNFDDCQTLVKQAITDPYLNKILNLSSANSINIARLIPQSFYYLYAYAQIKKINKKPLAICVPSGNFGNLTAGLIAKKMGLPIKKFIAATNANDPFPIFLQTGHFKPKDSVKTLSNAMDVGNPSNFVRILELYKFNLENIKKEIESKSYNDEATLEAIRELYKNSDYILDPHGAIGYMGIKEFIKNHNKYCGIFLETADPSKFTDIVNKAIEVNPPMPKRLEKCLDKEKQSIILSNQFNDLKAFLSSV